MRRCGFPKPAAGIRRQAHGPGSGRISVQHRKSVSPTPEISPRGGNSRTQQRHAPDEWHKI